MDDIGDGVFSNKFTRDFPSQGQQVIEVNAEDSINDAFNKLITHNILCAPVWDPVQQGYLGFFDINDVLNVTYDIDLMANVAKMESEEDKKKLKTSGILVLDIFNKGNQLRNPAMAAPWVPVGDTVYMRDVLPVLASGNHTKRVPVIHPTTGKVTKIISQLNVVTLLSKYLSALELEKIPPIFLETPKSTGIGLKTIIAITEDDEARAAFKCMVDNNISAVAVVDGEEGKMLSVISNKDISIVTGIHRVKVEPPRQMFPPMMAAPPSKPRHRFSLAASAMGNEDYLGMPSMIFVGEIRKQRELSKEANTHAATVSVHPDHTFLKIIQKLASTQFHRVFIVDDDHKPIGVVSVGDIIKMMVESGKKKPPPVPKSNRSGASLSSSNVEQEKIVRDEENISTALDQVNIQE